jgi:hypothetical protein
MTDEAQHQRNKAISGSKSIANDRSGGDAVQQAQEWGGGSKGSKGPVTPEDKRNQNSSAKT